MYKPMVCTQECEYPQWNDRYQAVIGYLCGSH